MTYPVMLQLKHRPVLIIGGGKVALYKAQQLIPAEPQLTVIATEFRTGWEEIPAKKIQKCYEKADLAGQFLIFAATDDAAVNAEICADAGSNALVNDCSNQTRSTFTNMAVVKRDALTIAISTQGKNPAYAKMLRQELENLFTHERLAGIEQQLASRQKKK